jgi:hypothetical protein
MDEKPYQLLGEVREPIPAKPGEVEKLDSEYKRKLQYSGVSTSELLSAWYD